MGWKLFGGPIRKHREANFFGTDYRGKLGLIRQTAEDRKGFLGTDFGTRSQKEWKFLKDNSKWEPSIWEQIPNANQNKKGRPVWKTLENIS